MILGEGDPGRKRITERKRRDATAEEWCADVTATFPRYGGDLDSLFLAQQTRGEILPAVLREFRPYPLPQLPQDAFVPLPNRDKDSQRVQTYFVGMVDAVSLDAPKIHKDQRERFIATRNALAACYKQPLARPLLDRLSIIAPEVLWAVEATYFNNMSSGDIGKTIGGLSQTQAYDSIQTGLYLLGLIEEARPHVVNRFLLPSIIRFPEISVCIGGLPPHIQLAAWEIVRGGDIRGEKGIAKKYSVSASQLEDLKDELFFGRLSFARSTFVEERRKMAMLHLDEIPYRQQPFTLLALQFLEAKVAGKGAGETGVNKNTEYMVASHMMQTLTQAFPELTEQIAPTPQKGVHRRADTQRRHFAFSPVFWKSIQERYMQFIDIMEKEGRSLTESDRLFIKKFLGGEMITKDDEKRVHVLLGAPRPQTASSENRTLLAEAFIQEGGLPILASDQMREVVSLIQAGTPFLQIMKQYKSVGPSQLVTLQKQMVGHLIRVRHQAWVRRIKEGDMINDQVSDANSGVKNVFNEGNVGGEAEKEEGDVVESARVEQKCILHEGHAMVLGRILFLPQNWRNLMQILAREGRVISDALRHKMEGWQKILIKQQGSLADDRSLRDLVRIIIPAFATAGDRQVIIDGQKLEPAKLFLQVLASIPAKDLPEVFDDLRFRFVTS